MLFILFLDAELFFVFVSFDCVCVCVSVCSMSVCVTCVDMSVCVCVCECMCIPVWIYVCVCEGCIVMPFTQVVGSARQSLSTAVNLWLIQSSLSFYFWLITTIVSALLFSTGAKMDCILCVAIQMHSLSLSLSLICCFEVWMNEYSVHVV